MENNIIEQSEVEAIVAFDPEQMAKAIQHIADGKSIDDSLSLI